MKPKPSKRISEIHREMQEFSEAELFFKYGVNDRNITSIIAYLDEQREEEHGE